MCRHVAIWTAAALLLPFASGSPRPGTWATGPPLLRVKGPLRQSRNPNDFEDAAGTPLILCGSHTWNTLQDWGPRDHAALDFAAFVRFLTAHGHNFTLLWSTELPRFRGLPTTETAPPDIRPRRPLDEDVPEGRRTGSRNSTWRGSTRPTSTGCAAGWRLDDGGMYAGVYLFTGEWLAAFRCAVDGYPLSAPTT